MPPNLPRNMNENHRTGADFFCRLVMACALLATQSTLISSEAPIDSAAPSGLKNALVSGKASLSLRTRYEKVDQAASGITKDAEAYTTRFALGYETLPWHDLTAFGQFEGVFGHFGDNYNSGINGTTDRPPVPDPEGAELHQAWIRYAPAELAQSSVKAGRQEIALDNQRFVGQVGWRQNWQSFDAATATSAYFQHLKLFYGYLDRVHRMVGDRNPVGTLDCQDSHLLNASYAIAHVGTATAYAYLVDFDENTAGPAVALVRQSTQTFGARVAGPYKFSDEWGLVYAAEYATQRDYGNHTDVTVDAHYTVAELGISRDAVSVKAGYEIMSGSGDVGDKFTTPLATLHAFDGWADMFTSTPDVGVIDEYVAVGGGVPIDIPGWDSFRFAVVYHRFESDAEDISFGDEIDLQLEYAVKQFDPNLVVGAKHAVYRADEGEGVALPGTAQGNVDTTKTWVYAQYSF
jgi:hypothetical protein